MIRFRSQKVCVFVFCLVCIQLAKSHDAVPPFPQFQCLACRLSPPSMLAVKCTTWFNLHHSQINQFDPTHLHVIYNAPLGLALNASTFPASHVSPTGRSLNNSQLARLRCIQPPFSICASLANSFGSFVWFLWLRSSPQRSHANASRMLSLSACALMYAASEAASVALSCFGEGSELTGWVSVVGTRCVPLSSRLRLECRACV